MMENDEFTVRLWGVRGSYPTPGASTLRHGGNTACVEVQAGGYTIILDGGTGLIQLGRDLLRRSSLAPAAGREIEAVMLFSHLHHDHTQGFPFFLPAYLPTSRLHVLGPDFLDTNIRAALGQIMQAPFYPVPLSDLKAEIDFGALREPDRLYLSKPAGVVLHSQRPNPRLEQDREIVKISVLHSYAHPQGVLHYRIEWRGHSVVYATDTECYISGNRRLASFAEGADVLIHDAQYTDEHYLGMLPGVPTTQGYGHSTISMACETARAAGVGQLVLFHHAPEYDDAQLDRMERRARELFPGAVSAWEGLELTPGEKIGALGAYPYDISVGKQQDHFPPSQGGTKGG